MRARGRRCPRAGEGRLGSGLPLLLKNSGGTAQVTPTDPNSHVASSSAGEKQLGSPCTDGDTEAREALASGGAPACQRPARLCALLSLRTALRGRLLPSLPRGRANPLPQPCAPTVRQTPGQGRGQRSRCRLALGAQAQAATERVGNPPQTAHIPQGPDPELAKGRLCNSPIGGSTGIPIFQAHGD